MNGGDLVANDIKGILVRYTGGDVVEYAVDGDVIYDVCTFRRLQSAITLGELSARLKDAGNVVEEFDAEEAARREERRGEARRMKPDYELGVGVPWGNAEYRRGARRSRTASRAMRRG